MLHTARSGESEEKEAKTADKAHGALSLPPSPRETFSPREKAGASAATAPSTALGPGAASDGLTLTSDAAAAPDSSLPTSNGTTRLSAAASAVALALAVELDEGEDTEEHAFFFSYGCVVFWGYSEEDEERVTAWLKAKFAVETLKEDEVRWARVCSSRRGLTRALYESTLLWVGGWAEDGHKAELETASTFRVRALSSPGGRLCVCLRATRDGTPRAAQGRDPALDSPTDREARGLLRARAERKARRIRGARFLP